MTNKEKYYNFCEVEKTIPIFSQAWWLDAVCGNAWDVCLVEKGGEIYASMPYQIKTSYGFTFLGQPPLTQNLGPWLISSTAKYSKILGQHKDLMEELISQLPKYHHFSQNWHYSLTNWLPFYWKGFQQTTYYTYAFDDLSNNKLLWNNLQNNIRTDIRKAQKLNLTVCTDLSIEAFIELNKMTYERQNIVVAYSANILKNLLNIAISRNQCQWFIAQGEKGNNHAGVLIVWDENSAYYLMGGGNPNLRNSGATSLCMWEAIKFASTVTKKFDFEGSMIESVERFFRAFGAAQKPYIHITKTPSKVLRIAKAFKKALRG